MNITVGQYLDLKQRERLLSIEGQNEELFFVQKQIDMIETSLRQTKKTLAKASA